MDAGVGELIDIEEFPPRRAGAVDHDIRGTAESEQRRGCIDLVRWSSRSCRRNAHGIAEAEQPKSFENQA